MDEALTQSVNGVLNVGAYWNMIRRDCEKGASEA